MNRRDFMIGVPGWGFFAAFMTTNATSRPEPEQKPSKELEDIDVQLFTAGDNIEPGDLVYVDRGFVKVAMRR